MWLLALFSTLPIRRSLHQAIVGVRIPEIGKGRPRKIARLSRGSQKVKYSHAIGCSPPSKVVCLPQSKGPLEPEKKQCVPHSYFHSALSLASKSCVFAPNPIPTCLFSAIQVCSIVRGEDYKRGSAPSQSRLPHLVQDLPNRIVELPQGVPIVRGSIEEMSQDYSLKKEPAARSEKSRRGVPRSVGGVRSPVEEIWRRVI